MDDRTPEQIEADFKKKLEEAPVLDVNPRQQFIDQVAAHYNAASPREQRRMDRGLLHLKAQRVAGARGLLGLFPTLGRTRPVKLKDPT